jgi:Fe-S-cluster containining protein
MTYIKTFGPQSNPSDFEVDHQARDRLSALSACTRCQVCCCKKGTPLITPEERDSIVRYSGRDEMVEWGAFFLMKEEPCPYLVDDRCSIQSVKPRVCVAWPVTMRPTGEGSIEIVKVKADVCAAAVGLSEEFIREAAELLKEMPESYQKATAGLTAKFGFEVEPVLAGVPRRET